MAAAIATTTGIATASGPSPLAPPLPADKAEAEVAGAAAAAAQSQGGSMVAELGVQVLLVGAIAPAACIPSPGAMPVAL